MPPKLPRAAAYLRVSVDPAKRGRPEEQQGTSIGGQLTEARKTALAQKWTLADDDVFEETMSASIYGRRAGKVRTEWARFLERIPDVDAIILPEISRGTRELGVYEDLAEICNQYKIQICIKNRIINLEDDSEFVMSGIEIVMAAGESKRISRRVTRGHQGAAEDGRAPMGRVPFGFTRPARGLGAHVTQEQVPDQARAIQEAAVALLNGTKSTGDIAKEWAERFGDVRVWDRTRVRNTLRNPAMIGKRVHNGKRYPGDWTAILKPIEFDRLDALFSDRERGKDNRRSHTLLSAIGQCGVCHAPLSYTRRLSQGQRAPLYRCPSPGGHVGVAQEATDKIIEKLMIDLLWFEALCRLRDAGDHQPDTSEWEQAQAAVTRATTRLSEFWDAADDEALSPKDRVQLGKGYRATLDAAEGEEKRLRAALSNERSDPETASAMVQWYTEAYERDEGDPGLVSAAATLAARNTWWNASITEQRARVKSVVMVEIFPAKAPQRIRVTAIPGAIPGGVVDLVQLHAELPRGHAREPNIVRDPNAESVPWDQFKTGPHPE